MPEMRPIRAPSDLDGKALDVDVGSSAIEVAVVSAVVKVGGVILSELCVLIRSVFEGILDDVSEVEGGGVGAVVEDGKEVSLDGDEV
jgi:hypothetical protein